MNDEPDVPGPTPSVDETEWPTHCEHCGTELESATVEALPSPDTEHRQTAPPGTVIAQDFCPNPDCPGRR